jgi:hypothetical protein
MLAADSVPWSLGAAAVVLLAAAVVRALLVVRGERAALEDLRRVVAGYRGELLVLDDGRPYAYAVPSGPGTIIVSTGMLTALDAAERRAMLAHERAHLTGHHHRYRLISRLAAAVNPAPRPLDRQITSRSNGGPTNTPPPSPAARSRPARWPAPPWPAPRDLPGCWRTRSTRWPPGCGR